MSKECIPPDSSETLSLSHLRVIFNAILQALPVALDSQSTERFNDNALKTVQDTAPNKVQNLINENNDFP
ncbi:hypothetical protein BH09PAT2_BH09PAT2_08100 [soil metagenome]